MEYLISESQLKLILSESNGNGNITEDLKQAGTRCCIRDSLAVFGTVNYTGKLYRRYIKL